MLDQFIKSNRGDILARTRAMVAMRSAPRPTEEEMTKGVPLFLEQLVARLRGEEPSSSGDLRATATLHGSEMLRGGFTVGQVVQDYGDVCQVVTELAIELSAPITTEEFRTLNSCLDMATAEAVTEYERQRDQTVLKQGTERLDLLAHDLRTVLHSAVIAFEILKRGSVGIGGSTGAVLGRSLSGLRNIIDGALAEVRLESGIKKRERTRVWELLEEVEVIAAFEANRKGVALTVTCLDEGAVVEIDRHMVAAAVGNLLQATFKASGDKGKVAIRTQVADGRVLIEVEDACGGIPAGGVGAPGLAISRRALEANGGELHVRDLPGNGCVFTVDLPVAPPVR